ncbi:MAG TPA: ROK family protein [Terriglobales bacterium]
MSKDRGELGQNLVIGVDIGGTKVAAGLISCDGDVIQRSEVPMHVSGSAADAMECVHAAIRSVLQDAVVSAIGVASPGPLQLPEGIVLDSPNLLCWHNFPLGEAIRREYALPTTVDNDANAAGLAEALWGAGAEFPTVFYATVGTGIGTAFVQNRQLYYGRTAVAPEGGHMTLDMHAPRLCECGKAGCMESMASGTAIARRARERLAETDNYNHELWGSPDNVTARTVSDAWHAGDPIAAELLRHTADLFSIWLGNIVDLLEPSVIVVGGGVRQLLAEWFPYIRERLPECSIVPQAGSTPIRLARFGRDAGIIGAAALCTVQTKAITGEDKASAAMK